MDVDCQLYKRDVVAAWEQVTVVGCKRAGFLGLGGRLPAAVSGWLCRAYGRWSDRGDVGELEKWIGHASGPFGVSTAERTCMGVWPAGEVACEEGLQT